MNDGSATPWWIVAVLTPLSAAIAFVGKWVLDYLSKDHTQSRDLTMLFIAHLKEREELIERREASRLLEERTERDLWRTTLHEHTVALHEQTASQKELRTEQRKTVEKLDAWMEALMADRERDMERRMA